MASNSSVNLEKFDELVTHIYRAASNMAHWPVYMKLLTETFNARSCMLRGQNLLTSEVSMWITHGVDESFQQRYREHFVHVDPIVSLLESLPVNAMVQTEFALPQTAYRKTEYFNDYAKPQDMTQIAGGILARNNSQVTVLGIHRPDSMGIFSESEMTMLNMLAPHMQQAVQINRHISHLEQNATMAGNALDQLPIGVVFVDAMGRAIFVNKRAENLTLDKNGLTIKSGRLLAITSKDTGALNNLISETVVSVPRQGNSLVIKHPQSAGSLGIMVTPIENQNRLDLSDISTTVSAAVFIYPTNQQYHFPLKMLNALYGLTNAEAQVAAALANGNSLEMIAKKQSLSKSTVRNQVKSCFQKTGVKRQAELVKLILLGVPTLVDNDETDIQIGD